MLEKSRTLVCQTLKTLNFFSVKALIAKTLLLSSYRNAKLTLHLKVVFNFRAP